MRARDEIAADLAVPGPKTLDDLDAGGLWIQARHRLARDVPALLAALGVAEAALAEARAENEQLRDDAEDKAASECAAHTAAADARADTAEAALARVRAETFDFEQHLQRQREWSARTFGPDKRTGGVLDHLHKELIEVEAKPDDTSEWIDVAILAFDGAWRHGATPRQIIAALVAKQAKNEARDWPDWRALSADQAIEHVRLAPVSEQPKEQQ